MSTPDTLHNLPAPAKLNLFLHVIGKQPDGYHQLQSVFMLLDWCDRLDITRTTDGRITRSDEGVSNLPADDLCVRAARALQRATGCSLGAHIHLHKHIPTQAGMGGGSSDAATVLLALDRLWNLQLDALQLRTIGLTLGADVPFFLFGRNAWVEGIGERLHAVELPCAQWLIVKPEAGVSTAAIFSAPDLHRATAAATMRDFVADPAPFFYGHNDLQAAATRLCPQIGQALEWLAGHGLQGRMTGSGSAVFALLPPGLDARFLPQTAPKNWIVKVCGNLKAHPLL